MRGAGDPQWPKMCARNLWTPPWVKALRLHVMPRIEGRILTKFLVRQIPRNIFRTMPQNSRKYGIFGKCCPSRILGIQWNIFQVILKYSNVFHAGIYSSYSIFGSGLAENSVSAPRRAAPPHAAPSRAVPRPRAGS